MKQLEEEILGRGEVSGTRFVQRAANDYAFIYECFPPEGKPYFEIFKRKENNQFDCVSYPTSKAFGLWAWCAVSAKRARKIFERITLREKEKPQSVNNGA